MKKRQQKRKKQIIMFLLVIILFSFTIFSLVTERKIFLFETIGRDILLAPSSFLVSQNYSDDTCKNVDQTLKLENEELQKEIKELKDMISLKNTLSDKVIVIANVIYRNLGYFYETITINRGSKDGITDDMAVVAVNGLIGKTIHVTENTSDVLLLTSLHCFQTSKELHLRIFKKLSLKGTLKKFLPE